jgi:hypothetical protein
MVKDRINCCSGRCATIWAGVIAGTLATLIQVLLWLIFTDDFSAILFRDARLTAALVLGASVLPPPATFDAGVMLTGIRNWHVAARHVTKIHAEKRKFKSGHSVMRDLN